jgi:hypothetical protein
MKCPNCQQENPTNSRFCQYCGVALVETAVSPAPSSPLPVSPATPEVAKSPSPAPSPAPIGQLGSGGKSGGSIWGPFAGYGTRGRHVSWLLDNLGHKAEALHEAMTLRFQQRQVPQARGGWQPLTAKGLVVERRPFYFIQRGITTVALYVAQFGQDLYISQVTYVKGPIGNVRLLVVALMLLFQLYYSIVFPAVLNNSLSNALGGFGFLSGGSRSFPFLLLCLVGPLGLINNLALLFLLIFSLYKWVRERDFLAVLRARPNEFQEDDTIAIEKAVEETVRQALDTVGIDPVRLTPAVETSTRPRII